MTADDICKALSVGKTPVATRQQENALEAAILASLRDHQGTGVGQVGDRRPAQWRLKTA